MRDDPVPVDLPAISDESSASFEFGPLHEEIEAVARDLIVLHGLFAHDKAIHLSEVARFLGPSKNGTLYRLAAHKIKLSFDAAWRNIRQRRTDGPPNYFSQLNQQSVYDKRL